MKTVGAVGNRRSRRARTWAVRVSAVATLTAFSASAFTSNGTAAVINPALVPAPAPVAEKAAPKSPKAPEPETYQERIDRIAQSPRSLLAPLQENQGKATVCVSGEFTSLSVVYDSLFESLLPSLPPQLRQNAYAARDAAHRDMKRLNVSTLAISDNPMALGADSADPSMTYRGPVSQWIVTQLLKIRDGQENEAIPLGNITLTQAVETVWLYLFVTVLTPAKVLTGLLPQFGSPFDNIEGAELLTSFVTYKGLLQLAVTGGVLGSQYVYQAISNSIMNQCIARVTDEQRSDAGAPSDDVTYHIDIPAIVRGTADQLSLADNDTCQQVGNVPLSRIVSRTSQYAQRMMKSDSEKHKIAVEERRILGQMRATQIPLNLIPADPADFSQIESLISMAGTISPFPIGAPLDIAIGLSHNHNEGVNFAATVPLSDLTVTKSITAAYYSYYLSLWFFQVGSYGVSSLAGNAGLSWLLGAAGGLGALPLTYGLVNFHNVIRSMCFTEDDATGTGRGAQVNRDNAVLPSASTTTPTVARPGRPSGSAPSSSPRRGASSPTPAPVIPGLPIRIPGIN
ncbi:MAG TPA: hypothetical protein DIW80_20785 [Gordonia polyisoprenivorans]|nr:hypothetical protein J8M97_13840 [Gordonia polyisoprenivorans]HCS59281.1 hypothetical protein [Gordonia polyisoprenivorans]